MLINQQGILVWWKNTWGSIKQSEGVLSWEVGHTITKVSIWNVMEMEGHLVLFHYLILANTLQPETIPVSVQWVKTDEKVFIHVIDRI